MKSILTSFVTSTSKQPFLAPSLSFLQGATKEVINEIILGIIGSYTTNDIVIIEGCVVTITSGSIPGTGTANLSAGSIYYNGEVYLVDAATGLSTTNPQTLVWSIATTYDATDGGSGISFSDGAQHKVHQINKFVLSAGTSGSGLANYNGATVYSFSQYVSGIKTLTTFTLTTQYSDGSGGSSIPNYRKDAFGQVTLNGIVAAASPLTGVFATLPVGYRPVTTKTFVGYMYATQAIVFLTVAPGGGCTVTDSTGALLSSKSFYTNSISFNINY